MHWSSTYGSCLLANGTLSYKRHSNAGPYEYLSTLFIDCTKSEIAAGYCPNNPGKGLKLNPCHTAQVVVEVSNDGSKFSGDGLTYRHTSLTDETVYNNHRDYIVPPTYAVFNYVDPKRFPTDRKMVAMDQALCQRAMYAEEGQRKREEGWFLLSAMQQARLSFDLTHLPDDFVYGEHWTIGVFARPSRCDIENCGSSRNRLPAAEYLPCTLPMTLPPWLTDASVPKNQVFNLTVLALEDMIFKVGRGIGR